MTIFFRSDRNQPCQMPPDLYDGVPKDDLAHVMVEAMARIAVDKFAINKRGTGSEQYHPRMMMVLIVSCTTSGIFASRRIEKATDHDTIRQFRAVNVARQPSLTTSGFRISRQRDDHRRQIDTTNTAIFDLVSIHMAFERPPRQLRFIRGSVAAPR